MNNLPTGTVTFLFTDIEDSTRLWETHPRSMKAALALHDQLLRAAVSDNNGLTIKTTGDGIHAVFTTAQDGVAAALASQRALQAEEWDTIQPDAIRVRAGLHSGEAELREGDYYGSAVNRAARLMSIGHGGQVLLSGITAVLAGDSLDLGVSLNELGEVALKGLNRPERVYQLVAPGLPADFPPLRAGAELPGNLPAQVSSFIGREREMAEVRRLLTRTRLLTLVGPGGTGKSRLSLQIAHEKLPSYEHGVWWVELAPVTDPELIPVAVAEALNLGGRSGRTPEEQLRGYLGDKKLLLILDNCEHLITASARLTADLLEACPHLTILTSSREGLGVYGETTYHLPTLSLPADEKETASVVGQSEAAQLFVERAQAAQARFRLTDNNAPAVAQIVRRLDGIPLAIELAASRIAVFGAEQIASRLDDRFRLLTGGSRTALPRQQTLRALIDWSYDLLDEDEQMLFRHLAVFVGGWSFDAADHMANLDLRGLKKTSEVSTMLDAFIILPQLVNKSLVVSTSFTEDAETDSAPDDSETTNKPTISSYSEAMSVSGEPYYHYLETIRQYARDRLAESGEAEAARDRHFNYYEQLADQMEFGTGTAAPMLVDGRMHRERDNLRAAFLWGMDRYPERVLDMAWGFLTFLGDQYTGRESRGWIHQALDNIITLPPAEGQTAEERQSVIWRGRSVEAFLAMMFGELDLARSLIDPLIEPLRESGHHPYLLALVLFVWAQAGIFLGDPQTESVALESAAMLAGMRDKPGAKAIEALTLAIAAQTTLARGDRAAAKDLLEQSNQVLKGTVFYQNPWATYARYVALDYSQLSFEERQRFFEETIAALRSNGGRIAAMIESDYGHFLRHNGQLDEAADVYRRTLPEWQDLGHIAAVANQLEMLAFIERIHGRPERAATMLGAAEHLREIVGQDMMPDERETYETELAELAATLPAAERDAAWAAGRNMDLDAAVDYALSS